MARQIKERMGTQTVNNKEKVNVNRGGQKLNSGPTGGCC